MSPTTGATISTLESISFGSMSIWMNFFGASPQVLPLPCDSSQLRRAPISITTSASFSTVERAAPAHCGCGVGQQALGHAHGQERNAALLDEALIVVVGLRVGRALAEDDQRTLCALEHVERALDRGRGGDLRRRGVDHLDQRLLAGFGVHHLAEQFCRAGRDRRRRDGPRPRRGWRARDRCRCRRRAARGTPPCIAAWRSRADPSPHSRPAAGRRSRAPTSPRSGSSGSSWWWRARARSGR